MRTTINVDEQILIRTKAEALAKGKTIGTIIENALHQYFLKQDGLPAPRPAPLPTFKGVGLQPGVDLDSSASLMDVMEGR